VDYFAPQLYWPLTSTGQNFTALLDWWISMNSQKRHVWPGLATYRVADGTSSAYAASEITNEINVVRFRSGPNAGGGSGTLLYNTTSIRKNYGGVADALAATGYPDVSVPPAYTWLDATPPAAPTLSVTTQVSQMHATWTANGAEPARWWLVQWRNATAWNAKLVQGGTEAADFLYSSATDRADVVMVTALDASWNASAPAVWRASAVTQ